MEKDILKKAGGLLRQRVELRYQSTEPAKAAYPLDVLRRVMRVSRSGFYAWRHRGPDNRRQAPYREVTEAHRRRRGSYGSRHMLKDWVAIATWLAVIRLTA